MRAARAFMTLACITSFCAIIFMIITAIMKQPRSTVVFISIGLVWFSALCGLIGMAVGIDFATGGNDFSTGAAAVVAIIGFIINVIGGIVYTVIPLTVKS